MPKGGRRPGAGRPPGSKTKKSVAIALAAAAAGESPLEFLLRTMRDETVDPDVRRASAIAAAPYVHPRLAATTLKGPDDGPLEVVIFKTFYDGAEAQHVSTDPYMIKQQAAREELTAARAKLAAMQAVPLLDSPDLD
jgi:hypothetical protein